MKKALLFFFISFSFSLSADVKITPASGGTDLSPNSSNVSNGWAALGDIIIKEGKEDDIAPGQKDASVILSAPSDWEFNAGEGQITGTGDVDDVAPISMSVASSEIVITFSTAKEGSSGKNELDIITISGLQIRPSGKVDPPDKGIILRTGGNAKIKGMPVSNKNSFGDLSLDNSNPLPVELTSFTAQVNQKKVVLKWSTATEINNFGFEIERMQNNHNWGKIGFVEGNGNSNSPKYYSFADSKIIYPGNYFYRLKQIDADGNFKYSKEINLEVKFNTDYSLSQNYPNPFNPSTEIQFLIVNSEKVSLKIYNSLGQEIRELLNKILPPGSYKVKWNAENLPAGIYFYSITTPHFRGTKKMILLK
jgi:hypothetical protein